MRQRLALAAAIIGTLLAALPGAAGAARTRVASTSAATPPMGFNDWNAYGCNVSASLIESAASYLHTSGMEADGYDDVNIDDCWLAPTRSATGALQADPVKFPQGIPAVARYVHKLGLKLGIYEDAGPTTCAGYPGSYGHYAQDAQTFASWGVDYVKFDQCNIPFANYPGMTDEQVDQMLYTQMSQALKATGRPMVFSACTGVDTTSQPWLWAPAISNLWRTTPDISDNFPSTLANFEGNVGLYRYAKVGAYNDPDMLEVGNGGQTPTQYRTQFSLWAEMAAPLIAGTNLTALSKQDLAIYTNRRVIAVDQDPLDRQGRPVSNANGLWVLTKRLADGQHAVALFNSTSTGETITTTAKAVGAAHAPAYRLENLWTGQVTRSGARISAFVPAGGTVMLRVRSLAGMTLKRSRLAPSTTLALDATPTTITPGTPVSIAVTLANRDRAAVRGAQLTVDAPAGFTPATARVNIGALAPGRSTSRTLTFTAPATLTTPLAAPSFTATATDRSIATRRTGRARAAAPVALVSPLTSPYAAANTTGDPTTIGQLGSDFTIQSAGTGITPQTTTSHGTRPASDAYAAVADPAAAGPSSTAQVTVTGQSGSTLRPYGSAGLIERPSLTAPGTPEGVVLSVSTNGLITLAWSAGGGTAVDTATSTTTPLALPVTLRLQRSGAAVVGAYSTDGGVTWTTVGTATLSPAAAGTDDAGVFHASGVAGWNTEADFTDFSVS